MKTIIGIAATAVACGAGAAQAHAQTFTGPTIGIEAAYEDYDGAEGDTVALIAGWDFPLSPDWIVGIGGRINLDGVKDSQSEPFGPNIATTQTAIEDQWALSARFGHVFGDRVLLFGEVGYERFHVDAALEVRAPGCVPPTGCLISTLDASFDEDMITYGVGAEWAVTDNWRLRGTYSLGDSDGFDRDRFAVSTSLSF